MEELKEFIVIRIYSKEDIDQNADPIEVQLFDENHHLIMSGNWENGINEKIEGFFKGLSYVKYGFEVEEENINAKGL